METSLIQAYIQGQLSDREHAQLMKLRQSSPDVRLLFDLIDACRRVTPKKTGRTAPLSRHRAELLFIRLLSGRISNKDAATFLMQLADPSFYALLQPLLKTAATADSIVDEPNVRIRSDAEIYDALLARLDVASSARMRQLAALFTLEHHRRLRWAIGATAVACLVLIMLVMHQPVHPLYDKYFASGSPLLVQSSALEGALRSSPTESDAEMDDVMADIKLAMASYVNGEYKQALEKFQKIEKTMVASPLPAAVTCEFYVHYGLTHLYLSRRGRRHHLDEAIRCLSNCQAGENRANADAIHFFLALACSMAGDELDAAWNVRAIPQQSNYFEDAKLILKEP